MTDGRRERASQMREERRRQILDAALEVFAERGYHGTSVSHIVEAAGVARGTFYLYFESKNVVFLELVDDLVRGFRADVTGVDLRPAAPSLREQLIQIVHRLLAATHASRAVATILFREAVVLDADVQARVRDFEDGLRGWLEASLRTGVALGLLRPHDPDVVSVAVFGSIRHAIERYVIHEVPSKDLLHVARELVDHSLRGVTHA